MKDAMPTRVAVAAIVPVASTTLTNSVVAAVLWGLFASPQGCGAYSGARPGG